MAGIGEILVRENIINASQLQKAQEMQRRQGGRLSANLVKAGVIQEKELTTFLSRQYNVPSINLDDYEIPPEIIKLIPKEVCEKHVVVPVNRAGPSIIIAVCDPSNIFALDDIKFLTGLNVEVVVASETSIKKAIELHYQESVLDYDDVFDGFDEGEIGFDNYEEDDADVSDLARQSEEAPVVRLVNMILVDAIKRGSSDIHLEPYEKVFRVRYRIDGVLHEIMKPPIKLKAAIVSRIKIMSELDIAERRLPQDGRIKLKLGRGREMDFRVSVLPTMFGEKVVMRLLDKSNLQLDMTKLGFEAAPLKDFKWSISQPYGMVLVTGPTGSGKTTTLYSALSELNKVTENISTAEDPIEYNLYGINQVQMNDAIGLNFAAALRSFLRQDPDIIMVGEIRDFETAEIAVKAALTGHLVLSTLHTNDAPSTVHRLLNMGVEPFLVTASVNAILAQRLARRVCSDCKEPDPGVNVQQLIDLGMKPEDAKNCTVMRGTGCRTCNDTGMKGRVALYEIMPMTDELKDLVLQGVSSVELKREAINLGMKTLRQTALSKLAEGITTVKEVVRCSAAD
ncbi:MAG: type IV-A pilus assembly ATPase PilB [Myxococcales bacterium]|nr:type IV-A pilus assembly ATPase PilB [Myxococcales bacterium]